MKKQFIKYGLGIDIGKDHFHCCIMGMSSDGTVGIIARRKFSQTSGGFSKHIVWLKKYRVSSESPLQVVLEATGVYHESLLFDL